MYAKFRINMMDPPSAQTLNKCLSLAFYSTICKSDSLFQIFKWIFIHVFKKPLEWFTRRCVWNCDARRSHCWHGDTPKLSYLIFSYLYLILPLWTDETRVSRAEFKAWHVLYWLLQQQKAQGPIQSVITYNIRQYVKIYIRRH